MSSISGPWPGSNVTLRLAVVRPIAGLSRVTVAREVLGVANSSVTGNQASLAGLAGSSARLAGLTTDRASPPPASCRDVSSLCCFCTCLSTEAPVPVRFHGAWPYPRPPISEPTCGGSVGSVTLRLLSILNQYLPLKFTT